MLKRTYKQVAKLIDTIMCRYLKHYNELPLYEVFYFECSDDDQQQYPSETSSLSLCRRLKDLETTLSPSLADSILIGLNFPGKYLNKFKSSLASSSHRLETGSGRSGSKRGKGIERSKDREGDKRNEVLKITKGRKRGRTRSEDVDNTSATPSEEIPDTCLLYSLLQEKRTHTLSSSSAEGSESALVKMDQLYDKFAAHLRSELLEEKEEIHHGGKSLQDTEGNEDEDGDSDGDEDNDGDEQEDEKGPKKGRAKKKNTKNQGDGVCSERYLQALSELVFVGVVSTPKTKTKTSGPGHLRLCVF
eukprot:TRINITY_DN7025_c0_g1_i1.p2 TRINITY_DN7025_c0_g1~~TRINITY_DN7025_c0_g1_i1.p2  ORF type:complete len:303 (-),score=70.72 TRINITY_DN7025_c0_g1_i1:99-1007(-)